MVAMERTDVVVVGGGPAGSSTAIHLARAGLDVTLFDRAWFPREKSCAEYCSPGVVDALDDLGALGRIGSVSYRELPRMRVVARGRELPLDFVDDRPDGNRAMGIKRSVLDAELLELAGEQGVRILQGTRVTGPVVEGESVSGVRYRNGQGDREMRAGFVAAADGLHSTIARSLGLERPVRWPRRLGLVARYSGLKQPVRAGQMHIGDGVYCGMSPVGEDEVNVSLVVPMGSKPGNVPTAEFFESNLRRLPGISELLDGAERTTRVRGLGPMGKRVSARSGSGFLLVGDAAGFFDPLTGEGIHRALLGGELAARKVMTAIKRPDRVPAGYERERSRLFNDKERVCQIIQTLVSFPRALEYVAVRASEREQVSQTLCGILGDYAPARQAFRPSFLWNLFRL